MNATTDRDIRRRAAAFAEEALGRWPDLIAAQEFPEPLWELIGAHGLAGLALPENYGGTGGDWTALAVLAEALGDAGGVPGLTTSVLGPAIVARLHVLAHGSEAQKRDLLPAMARGDLRIAFAVSEPGRGAHPKHLQTRAERQGDSIVLNGEKAYLTNGPSSGLFMVLAISGEKDGRRQFSAYLVPKDTPGLEITEGVRIDFLHPAGHCGIRLQDCRVPASALLGEEGRAFELLSLPMRRVEDALFAAGFAGAFRHLLRGLAPLLQAEGWDEATQTEFGRLSTAPAGLSAMARHAAATIEGGDNATIEDIAAHARDSGRGLLARVATLVEKSAIELPVPLRLLQRDLEKTLSIAATAHDIRARQRAQKLAAPA